MMKPISSSRSWPGSEISTSCVSALLREERRAPRARPSSRGVSESTDRARPKLPFLGGGDSAGGVAARSPRGELAGELVVDVMVVVAPSGAVIVVVVVVVVVAMSTLAS